MKSGMVVEKLTAEYENRRNQAASIVSLYIANYYLFDSI